MDDKRTLFARWLLIQIAVVLCLASGCTPQDVSRAAVEKAPTKESASSPTPDSQSTAPTAPSVDAAEGEEAAGMTFTHFLAGMPVEVMAAESRYDVVVATIEKVSEHAPTNGEPPRVTLNVHEVLRGDPLAIRSRGYWTPFPHDVDWDGPQAKAIIERWEKQPMKNPAVGAKQILFGERTKIDGQSLFWISPVGRFDDSEEHRELARRGIKQAETVALQRKEERLAKQQEHEARMAAWRAKFSAEEITRFAKSAAFVGVGKVCSGPQHEDADDYYDFAVPKVLKGETRRKFNGDAYYVTVLVPHATGELLAARDREFVLFLSDEHAQHGDARDYYIPITAGDGIVEADAEALRATHAVIGSE